MTKKEMLDTFYTQLKEYSCGDRDQEIYEASEGTAIFSDLGLDSLDVVELYMSLEEAFEIQLDDPVSVEAWSKFTIKNMLDELESGLTLDPETFSFEHLLVNKNCDCDRDIKWVAANIPMCRINKEYKDLHEPTFWGVSISVQLPKGEDHTGTHLWAEFAANDEGWMYVSDHSAKGLEEIPTSEGILEVEANAVLVMEEQAAEQERDRKELHSLSKE